MPGKHRFDKTRQRARELRQQMTPAEVILWDRLAEYGYRVLRVSNQEIESDLESVICHILEACHAGSVSPLPGLGEGQG
jgi:very-short-patch-repair endonuclease